MISILEVMQPKGLNPAISRPEIRKTIQKKLLKPNFTKTNITSKLKTSPIKQPTIKDSTKRVEMHDNKHTIATKSSAKFGSSPLQNRRIRTPKGLPSIPVGNK